MFKYLNHSFMPPKKLNVDKRSENGDKPASNKNITNKKQQQTK
jgi:hypothetical protein